MCYQGTHSQLSEDITKNNELVLQTDSECRHDFRGITILLKRKVIKKR